MSFLSSTAAPIVRKGIEFKVPTLGEISKLIALWAQQDADALSTNMIKAGANPQDVRNEFWETLRIAGSFIIARLSLMRFNRALEVCQKAAPQADLAVFDADELIEIASELWGQDPTKAEVSPGPLSVAP